METRLLEMLKEELGLFEQMKAQTVKQTELLAEDKIDEFIESLDKREELKEKINGLHQESNVLMQYYISSTVRGGRGKVRAIDKLREQNRVIIAECHKINEENIKAAGEKMEEYTKRLKEMDTEKKTFDAYTVDIPDNSEHFDKTT
jgi:transcriptional regulator of NAD metabolism